ncbi:DUF1460 domain-containing protein [Salmonella enterica]|nr:DUF1460 domain-containing protein [Salmonella enterica]
MARRQILSLSERESLLALPDDELTLTRMAYFSEHDLALISAHRKPASRFGFAVLLCYLKNVGFAPDKKIPPSDALLKHIASRLKLTGDLWPAYLSDTLIGGPDAPESLVVNFNGVDCFTLADYVEALTRSHDQKSFLHNLTEVRYTEGNVDYLSRRHVFSAWFATTPRNARDVTPDISPGYATADKQLNRKPDGGEYIPGLGIHSRKINYIPGKAISQQVLDQMRNGDYVGVYSPLEGLDVSHVGIVVRHDGQVWFRFSSTKEPFVSINRATSAIPS